MQNTSDTAIDYHIKIVGLLKMLQNMWTVFLAKVATVDDHIHFGFFGRIPHEFTFKVDGIGRGSINQVSLGQGLGQQCAYIFKPFKRGRTFHFLGGRTVVGCEGNYILEPIRCKT